MKRRGTIWGAARRLGRGRSRRSLGGGLRRLAGEARSARGLSKLLPLVLVVMLGLAAAGAVWMFGPGPAPPEPLVVRIAAGSGRRAIARQLAQAGVLRTALGFELWSLTHRGQTLQAGTYRFPRPITPVDAFNQIARGEIYAVTVTIPEGFNRFDIAHLLATRGLTSADDFLQATSSPAPIRDLDPAAVSLEGYLFPATYRITPGTPPAQIVAQMLARFRAEVKTLDPPPNRLHAWVTLASIIEKETPVPAERALIAGVFTNRLRRGMPLQSDPTTTYATLTHEAGYNTYQFSGLPPGPIANPGAAALAAAAHPATTRDLYFVSNGHGAHRFARTLAEQDANVRLYRLATREQTTGGKNK